jgi:hypothetical protein
MVNKFEGPKMPDRSPEQILAEKQKTVREVAEWFQRISVQLDPERLKELQAMARFASAHLKSEKLSERDTSDDSEIAVSEAVVQQFQEYHKWLRSIDAQQDTDYFRKKVKSWFTDEAYNKHEGLVARMANHMTEEEQKKEGLIE